MNSVISMAMVKYLTCISNSLTLATLGLRPYGDPAAPMKSTKRRGAPSEVTYRGAQWDHHWLLLVFHEHHSTHKVCVVCLRSNKHAEERKCYRRDKAVRSPAVQLEFCSHVLVTQIFAAKSRWCLCVTKLSCTRGQRIDHAVDAKWKLLARYAHS